MKKRISCKIINSVPINETGADLRPVRQRNECLYEFDQLMVASFWFKHARKIAGNFKSLQIDTGIISDVQIGQILDCLA